MTTRCDHSSSYSIFCFFFHPSSLHSSKRFIHSCAAGRYRKNGNDDSSTSYTFNDFKRLSLFSPFNNTPSYGTLPSSWWSKREKLLHHVVIRGARCGKLSDLSKRMMNDKDCLPLCYLISHLIHKLYNLLEAAG